jgi:3'-phosphoadenosine 5'-phosphosulfate sulfotransferase (PAPS reductase)/FAD synthetase
VRSEQLPLTLAYAPRHVVLFSGGHSSALVAVEVVRRYGRNGVVLLNHDINPRVEDPDIKRFKREVAAHLGIPITQADHPRVAEWDQFDVMESARAFKVRNGEELCTSRLKTEPFKRWLAGHCPPGSATMYYGFDAAEEHRIRRRATILAAMGYESAFPLAHWPRTIRSTREVGIEPPLTYSTFKHANCVGCTKAGWQHWYVVRATRPDVWERAKLAEERIGHSIHRDAYLHEREEELDAMLAAGVEPTEHVPSGAFWSNARKATRHLPLFDEVAAKDERPCECVFVRPPKRGARDTTVCTCLAPPGEGHALHCARVLGTREAA